MTTRRAVVRKSKRERFVVVASRRATKVVRAVRLLAKCSSSAAYEYAPEEIEEIFDAIEVELHSAKNGFLVKPYPQFSFEEPEGS